MILFKLVVHSSNDFSWFLVLDNAVSCDFTYMSIFLHEPVGNDIYIVHENALTFFFLVQLVYW